MSLLDGVGEMTQVDMVWTIALKGDSRTDNESSLHRNDFLRCQNFHIAAASDLKNIWLHGLF
jgi:hypothetical protein